MTSLTSDGIACLSLICMVVGGKAASHYLHRRAVKKLKAERTIKVQAARGKSERDMTFNEIAAVQADIYEEIAVRGKDTPERRSARWARLQLDYELGHFADKPATRILTFQERDLLITNARIDAAEALANSQELLVQARRWDKASEEFAFAVYWLGLIFLIYQFFKTGLAP